ncbi:MAG: hypothetical protein KAH20_01600 [Methylococcales bacterium]|nr:hypothetical protein [Methylococcales bacterium]
MFVRNCIALSFLCLSGCASIVSQSDYPVTVNSSPDGATFVIKNQAGVEVENGMTPKQVTLTTKAGFFDGETYTVKFDKTGYQSNFVVLDTQLDDWYFGNILFGGTIGSFIVDPLTGAMWELPEESSVSLMPE